MTPQQRAFIATALLDLIASDALRDGNVPLARLCLAAMNDIAKGDYR
jgi:hypothetical protein